MEERLTITITQNKTRTMNKHKQHFQLLLALKQLRIAKHENSEDFVKQLCSITELEYKYSDNTYFIECKEFEETSNIKSELLFLFIELYPTEGFCLAENILTY